jgi:type I restriction enzyme, S subunit
MKGDRVLTANSQVPEGYKQTEVGVIPEDWEVDTIGQSMNLINGRAFKPSDWMEQGIPIIRIQNLNDLEAPFNYCSVDVHIEDKHRLEPGDLVFAWSGTKGSSFGARIWAGSPGVLNQHIFKVIADSTKLTPHYSFLILLRIQEEIEKRAHGFKASFVHVKKSDLVGVYLPIPTIAEQNLIASALSDTDALIESLEQLLAKKRQIKQGAMQELLTGKRRLSGFGEEKGYKQTELGMIPEDWDVVALDYLIKTLDAGTSVNSAEEKNSLAHEKSILKTSCVFSGDFVPSECKPIISSDIYRAKLNPRKDAIIISRMNTPALVGECGYVDRDYPYLFLPDRLWMTRPDENKTYHSRWLAFLLSFSSFNKAIKDCATGTSGSMKNISKNSLLSIKISLPIREEQTAIATILSDMDLEIGAIETKLTKARQLKQGMMHELLTGKIRLIDQGEAHDH